MIDRESISMDRWIKDAIYVRKEQDKSMNRDAVATERGAKGACAPGGTVQGAAFGGEFVQKV